MLWNLIESSEIVLFCILFYGKPSGWYDTICTTSFDFARHNASFIRVHKYLFSESGVEVCLVVVQASDTHFSSWEQ